MDAEALGSAEQLVTELCRIDRERRNGFELAGIRDAAGRRSLARLENRMRALAVGVERPLAVDLRLGGSLTLPSAVAATIEAAGDVLARLTPHPGGHPAWRAYQNRYLERFGAGSLVPLNQLVDATAGLGFPAHFTDPTRPAGAPGLSQRDRSLLLLAHQAALDGTREMVLDDDFFDGLVAGAEVPRPAPHVEVSAEVHADSAAALDAGQFTVQVVGVSRTGLAMNSRFLEILPDADRQRMIRNLGRLPVGVDGAVAAQLSFPPRYGRMDTVTRTSRLLPDWISVAEHQDDGPGRIPLDDLAVTADDGGMYLVSLSRRRVIEPVLTNAAARHTMPPLARLLHELPRARTSAVSPFAWGAAGCLPFLPRVRCGSAVLSPARWAIRRSDLPGPRQPSSTWAEAIGALRARVGLPGWVSVGTADVCLRLNLDASMDLDLLRAHVDGQRPTGGSNEFGETVVLAEAADPADYGWLGGRAHEIVVPLATRYPDGHRPGISARLRSVLTTAGPLPVVGREHGQLPGASPVVFAKIYGDPAGFDTILTDRLPDLLATFAAPPRWWFVRYRDPSPHLRLRLHLVDVADYGPSVVRVGDWAADLRRGGLAGDLVLDTYHPETARYGAGVVMTAAEGLFAADSVAAVAELAAVGQPERRAVTVASMVDLTGAVLGNRLAGMRWLLDHRRPSDGPPTDRRALRQAINFVGDDSSPFARLTAAFPKVEPAWQARHHAAAHYASALAEAASRGHRLSVGSVLGSLLHLHHIRTHGIDIGCEQACQRLARAVALAWNARQTASEEDSADDRPL